MNDWKIIYNPISIQDLNCKCSLMSCERVASFEARKIMDDGKILKNYSCDAHLSANLNILRENEDLHRRYWDDQKSTENS